MTDSDPAALPPPPAGPPAVERSKARTTALVILSIVVAAAALYLSRELLVPIAFAGTLAIVFRPAVRAMEKLRIAPAIASAIVVLALIAGLSGIAIALAGPVRQFIDDLPAMFDQAVAKLEPVRAKVQKITDVADRIQHAADGSASRPASGPSTAPIVGGNSGVNDPKSASAPSDTSRSEPIRPGPPVAPRAPSALASALGTTSDLLAALIEVLLLLFLLLAGGQHFVSKAIDILPLPKNDGDAHEVAHRIETAILRYLLVTALINVVQGTLVGLIMWWIGMPNPILWAVFTFVLEFIPYLGAAAMVAMLTLVAFTTFQHTGQVLLAPAAYFIITAIQNNVVSPFAYGKGLKLHPVAILLAVMLWAFLWGIPGAFMAVPILAVTKIITDQIAMLRPVGKFLGE